MARYQCILWRQKLGEITFVCFKSVDVVVYANGNPCVWIVYIDQSILSWIYTHMYMHVVYAHEVGFSSSQIVVWWTVADSWRKATLLPRSGNLPWCWMIWDPTPMGMCLFANEPRVSILNTVILKLTIETNASCCGFLLSLTPCCRTKREFNACFLGYIPWSSFLICLVFISYIAFCVNQNPFNFYSWNCLPDIQVGTIQIHSWIPRELLFD